MRTALVPLALAAAALAAPGAAAAEQSIDVYLHDWLHITPETIQAEQGDVLNLKVINPEGQSAQHDLVFEGLDVRTPLLAPGQTLDVTLVADQAGAFTYYCSVPGHREGGMVGNLVVRAASVEDPNESPAPAALAALGAAAAALALARRRRA